MESPPALLRKDEGLSTEDGTTAPLFSVVIPSYNRLPLLKEALQSVDAQTFRNFEIIVVDDGSTDDTVTWLSENRPDIRVVSGARKGPGGARNAGVRVAGGRYVSFLDSDDVWHPETLERTATKLETTPKPSFVLLRDVRFSGPTSGINWNHASLESKLRSFGTIQELVLSEGTFVGSGLWGAVSRECFTSGDYFKEDEPINMEDLDWLLRVGDRGPALWIAEPPLVACRQHGAQSTGNIRLFYRGAHWLLSREANAEYPAAGTPLRKAYLATVVGLPIRLSRSIREIPDSMGLFLRGLEVLGIRAMARRAPKQLLLIAFGWMRN
jgi:glycosyltransferase involved in cell wall biosynthesis